LISLLDDHFLRCESLEGPPYNYAGGRGGESLALAQQRGVDWSGMMDVSREDLRLLDSGGIVRIANEVIGRQPYRSDGWYLWGTVLVNGDVGPNWDDSHAAVVSDADNQLVFTPVDWMTCLATSTTLNQIGKRTLKWASYLPQLGVDFDPHCFPSWFAPAELLIIHVADRCPRQVRLARGAPGHVFHGNAVRRLDSWSTSLLRYTHVLRVTTKADRHSRR
jgi:hypothetical protein